MEKEIRNYVQLIYQTTDHHDRVLVAARGFINLFSATRVHIVDYSVLSGNIEGVFDVSMDGINVLNLKDNVRNLALLRKAIRKQETIYSHGPEYILQSPAQYVTIDMFRSYVIIVPITSGNNMIGYACPFFGDNCDSINQTLLDHLSLYGRFIGNALVSLNYEDNLIKLSKREIEILQHISWGETVKEIASYMKISEFTIQDYIKSAIKKLNARNRMHAVSEALRLGLIM